MERPPFHERVAAVHARSLRACAGLDPVTERMPPHLRARHGADEAALWRDFLGACVEAVAGRVGAYKPNWAFFLARGAEGVAALASVCAHVRARDPDALLVLDMKVGDIADTNLGYVRFAFDELDADAVTLHPYLGGEALAPFLRDARRGAFVLCRTSNPGAAELQHLRIDPSGEPLHLAVARRVAAWNALHNCGLVVGATAPDELRAVRAATPELPLLIPGVGKQGGSARAVGEALRGGGGAWLVNQSSGFLYASQGADFADAGAAVLAAMQRELDG